MKKITIADFFCGAGGFSEGFKRYVESKGIRVERWVALNHWSAAIETHAANHPFAEHYQQPIFDAEPRKLFPAGKLDILLASPECTYFSNARGGGECNEQSRSLAQDLIRWATEIDIHTMVVENVKEFQHWGPLLKQDKVIEGKLYKKGTPDPRRKGEFFRKFRYDLRRLGYKEKYRFLNSANYGAYTARERLFLIATKERVSFPDQTHTKEIDDLFLQPWQPAYAVIDWDIQGHSIFARQAGLIPGKKPLCEKTINRICYGLEKFCKLKLDPYLVMLYGQSNARSLNLPLPTITNGNHLALCSPYITKQYGTGKAVSINDPLPTITTSGTHFNLVEPYLLPINYSGSGPTRVNDIRKPLPTLTTKSSYYLAQPYLLKQYGQSKAASLDYPLPTVTTKDRFNFIEPITNEYQLDILYRMLEPHELAKGMGFDESYKFIGTKTNSKKMIGNAVEVNQAMALASVVVPLAFAE